MSSCDEKSSWRSESSCEEPFKVHAEAIFGKNSKEYKDYLLAKREIEEISRRKHAARRRYRRKRRRSRKIKPPGDNVNTTQTGSENKANDKNDTDGYCSGLNLVFLIFCILSIIVAFTVFGLIIKTVLQSRTNDRRKKRNLFWNTIFRLEF